MTDRDWTELAPAYVLGALEPDERAAFEARLADDPSLRSEVDRFRETVGVMGLGVGDYAPPPELRETILARARQVATADPPRQAGTIQPPTESTSAESDLPPASTRITE